MPGDAAGPAGERLRPGRWPAVTRGRPLPGSRCSPGVPAGGLRRGRRARGVPGPGAAPAWSTSPCTARAATGPVRSRTSRGTSWPGRTRRCSTISTDLSMTAAVGGADLVHSHTWYANLAGHLAVAAVRRAARDDRALAGAAAAVEGRAARRRLRAVQLVRAGGRRVGRRGHRGVRRHAGRRAGRLPGGARGAGAGHPQRHRHRRVRARSRHGRAGPVRDRPGRARRSIFVGRITRQKGVPVLLRAAASLAPEAQLVLCAGAAGHPGAGRRGHRPGRPACGPPGPG